MPFIISRSIEIDAAHRVPTHGSKCANLHGHRYKVIAECSALSLHNSTEQKDMVLDFGFLKEVLIEHVDKLCDHGIILWIDDPYAEQLLYCDNKVQPYDISTIGQQMSMSVSYHFQEGNRGFPTKLLIVPFIPTAERLAEFWYKQMKTAVSERSKGLANLNKVIVWETPNCSACFPM